MEKARVFSNNARKIKKESKIFADAVIEKRVSEGTSDKTIWDGKFYEMDHGEIIDSSSTVANQTGKYSDRVFAFLNKFSSKCKHNNFLLTNYATIQSIPCTTITYKVGKEKYAIYILGKNQNVYFDEQPGFMARMFG